jgi:phosphohistidine phosphatase SixA
VRPAFSTTTVTFEEGLYAASSDELLERLRLVPHPVASVLLIGHNPGLQELPVRLAAAGDELARLKAKFPTGALAKLVFETTGVDSALPTLCSPHMSFQSSSGKSPKRPRVHLDQAPRAGAAFMIS